MGTGGPDGRLGATDREEHDRLPCRAGRLGERTAVAEVLAVDADHLRAVVRGEIAEDVRHAEVGLVADGREPRETEAEILEQEAGLERDVAALRDEADRARRQRVGSQVELPGRVEDAETVRPEQHGAGGADAIDDRPLALVPDPGGDRDDRLRAGGERLVDGLLEPCRRDAEHDELGRCGQLGERAVHGEAVQLAAASSDEVDRASVRAARRVAREPVAPLAGVGGDAHDRERARLEQSDGGRGSSHAEQLIDASPHVVGGARRAPARDVDVDERLLRRRERIRLAVAQERVGEVEALLVGVDHLGGDVEAVGGVQGRRCVRWVSTVK